MATFFISYNRADNEFLEKFLELVEGVYGRGSVWYDQDIQGGKEWWEQIEAQIVACPVFLFLISNDTLESKVCRKEFRKARDLKKPILPIIVRPKTNFEKAPKYLQTFLSRTQYVDMSNSKDEGAVPKLYAALQTITDELEDIEEETLSEAQESPHGTSNHAEVVSDPYAVPGAADKFIGRGEVLERVMGLLEKNERVLLQGFGGEGKTALASECAKRWLQEKVGTSVLWLEIGNVSFGVLLENIAAALNTKANIVELDEKGQERQFRQWLTNHKFSLVVVDDVWNSDTLNHVINATPHNIPLLVTSCQNYSRLRRIEVAPMNPDEALDLLHVYVEEKFRTSQDAEVCETVAYMAFAIEIAGRTMAEQGWDANGLLRELEKVPIHDLTVPSDLEDNRNVAALIQTSLNALDEQTQQVFYAFGAFFVPTITVELMALHLDDSDGEDDDRLSGLSDFDPDNLPDDPTELLNSLLNTFKQFQPKEVDIAPAENALQTLHRYGLVKRIPATDEAITHFRIHDLGYSFATAKNTGEHQERALYACLNYTGQYNQPSLENFARLRPELEQFEKFSEWALKHGHYQAVQGFAYRLYVGSEILDYLGFYKRSIHFLKWAVVAARKQGDQRGEGNHLGNLSNIYRDLGQYQTSIRYIKQSLEITRDIGDKRGEGTALGSLGVVYSLLGQYRRAIKYCQQALAIARKTGDRHNEGNWLGDLGNAYNSLGKYKKAITYYEQVLVIASEIRERRSEGAVVGGLGTAYFSLGEYEKSIMYYKQALAITHEIGDRRGEGNHLGNLGLAYLALDDCSNAIDHYQQSIAVFQDLGLEFMVERVEGWLAEAREQCE